MLVLTRKTGQSILLGDDIRVTLVSIRGNQVKLAIDAPRSMPVDRAEVRLRQPCAEEMLSSAGCCQYNLALS